MNNKIIVLDAGHGINTPGKRCLKSIDPNETREWMLNSRIADLVQLMLDDYECDVIRVDDSQTGTDVSLKDRCAIANKANADIYVSIHHNAGISGGSGGGTAVYHYSSHPEYAEHLYKKVVEQTELVGNRSKHVIKNAFYVLVNTKMEAVLIENGFMDSTIDTPIILTDSHASKTAKGIVNFLIDVLALEKRSDKKESEIYVKIPCDSIKNATMLAEYMKGAGYDPEIVTC